MELWLISPAAADFKYLLTVPTDATGGRMASQWNAISETTETAHTVVTSPTTGGAVNIITTGIRIIVAGNAGNLQLQWAQTMSNAGDTQTLPGSLLVVWEEIA